MSDYVLEAAKPKEDKKIDAEIAKLIAETTKINAETMKIHSETRYYPLAMMGAILVAGGAVITALAKLFA